MKLPRLALLALFSLSACGGDTGSDITSGSEPDTTTGPELDASFTQPALPGDAGDAGATTTSTATWPYDSGVPPFTPPAQPSSFRLSHATGCSGPCPSYRVAIEQTGRVDYAGDICTERPGRFTQQLSPSAARALYDEFVRLEFWSFGPHYASKADGCVKVFTDSETSSYEAAVDGYSQSSTRYDGCRGIPWLAGLDELGTKIDLTTEVKRWRGEPGAGGCVAAAGSLQIQLETSYVLRQGETPLGVLTLERQAGTWALTACSGALLAQGKLLTTAGRATLLGVDAQPITLPLDGGDVASIVIDRSPTSEPKVRALRARPEDDVPLTLVSATGC